MGHGPVEVTAGVQSFQSVSILRDDRARRHHQCARRPHHRPGLESLEPRVVLSPTAYTVDSADGGTSGSGTSGTLPYVISLANANTNPDGSEISFDPTVFSTPQTIDLDASLVLSETSGPEVIDGPEAGSCRSAAGSSVFQVQDGVTATISGLTITGAGATSPYRDEAAAAAC